MKIYLIDSEENLPSLDIKKLQEGLNTFLIDKLLKLEDQIKIVTEKLDNLESDYIQQKIELAESKLNYERKINKLDYKLKNSKEYETLFDDNMTIINRNFQYLISKFK